MSRPVTYRTRTGPMAGKPGWYQCRMEGLASGQVIRVIASGQSTNEALELAARKFNDMIPGGSSEVIEFISALEARKGQQNEQKTKRLPVGEHASFRRSIAVERQVAEGKGRRTSATS